MTAAPARVALLGFGLAGRVFHAPLIAAEPGLELAVIVTRDPARRAQAIAEHPGAALADDAAQVWERAGELDLVVVATPNSSHVALAIAALDEGLAVVVDKPLAPEAAGARALVEHAEHRGGRLTVFQNRRWDGDLLTLSALLEDGRLGTVLRFESRFDRWRPQTAGGWRDIEPPGDGGGLLLDLGSHLVDQAVQLFGRPVRVYGELDMRRAGAAADDDVFVALEHEGGVRSHLGMSALAAQIPPRMRVLGDAAAFVKFGLDVQEDQLAGGLRPGDPGWGEDPPERWGTVGSDDDAERVATARGEYERFYAGVARALRDGGAMPVDPWDAVRVLEVLDAARRSAAGGRVVRLG
ncbi:MAG TPA: Gfo/Idh/MocA family oxidoreductase [Solirubrobacteraceae bacterium]|nr:Gfo/Idh/MocA family oxidoreductase [Solirubrobacteraceae bacterium]